MVVFPIIATLIALGCAGAVGRDYVARPKPDKIAWLVAFAMFGLAAGAEVLGELAHWTPLLARAYYALGATLVVGYLALGELYLVLPGRRAQVDRIAGGLVALSALGAALVWRSPFGADVANRGWHALEPSAALTALTIGINSVGTLVLVGGLLYSVWRFRRLGLFRNRMLGCLLIAAGTLVVASGGTLTRFGADQLLYIAMALGVGLIFGGYLKAKQPDVARALLSAAPTASGTSAAEPPRAPVSGTPPAAPFTPATDAPRAVTATFIKVAESGEVVAPAECAARLGLRPGDLAALVETPAGLLLVTREQFVAGALDQIAADLAVGQPQTADAPPVAVLRGRRSS